MMIIYSVYPAFDVILKHRPLPTQQMEEAHRNLLAQLQEREASVTKLQTAASQLLSKCRPEGSGDAAELTDSLVMQEQLAGLNAQWTKVQLKAKARSDNLKVARKIVSL